MSQQVSNTLQALASRPGVESTLILSRKDGSIIRVTGALEDPPEQSANGATTLDPTSPTLDASNGDDRLGSSPKYARTPPTRAEKMASDIFHFVSVAGFLASSIELSAVPKGSNGFYQNGVSYGQSKEATSPKLDLTSDEVQLLRMRSKNHEVIIFPDPNFLCCVVQNMERQKK